MKTAIEMKAWVLPLKVVLILGVIAGGMINSGLPLAGMIACLLLFVLVQIGSAPLKFTHDYIQSGTQKMLFREIADAKRFLGMLWIFDEYGESICLAPQFYVADQFIKISERINGTR